MENLEIRRVKQEDLEEVIALFAREVYPWDPTEAETHFADHREGGGASFLAYVDGRLAAYVTIRWVSRNERFREENIPLIHHLGVFDQYQRRGIASRLMDEAEALIATRARKAGITVGIFDAYGPAQRLYAKRGYIPDGRGVCQGHRPIQQGETLKIDHDLIIWMTKDLS